jgi:uncharacterized protein YjbI with pentapeptide repeats
MQYNQISYPVNLGNWDFGCSGEQVYTYYNTWAGGTPPEPYAGGFALVVWYPQDSGDFGSPVFHIWWVGPGQFALQTSDTSIYAAIATGNYKGLLSLTDGSSYANQNSILSILPNGTFTMENLNGNFAIGYQGNYLYVYGSNWLPDWPFYVISPQPGPPKQYQTFHIDGVAAQFIILLISGSGVGLNLSAQDLSEGNYIASVSGTDFTGANLSNANLSKLPNLSVASCNFTGATLGGADLTGLKDLNQANWGNAILSNTDLSHVDPAGITGVNFSTANLTGAKLSNGQPLGSNYNYQNTNFAGANLENAILDGISFVGANFTGAKLAAANLTGADLSNADLTGANLTGAILAGAKLIGATLSGTIFNQCNLSTAQFSRAPAFGNSAGTRTLFQNATVPGTSLGLNWSYIDLTGATLSDVPTTLSGLVAEYTLFPDEAPLAGVALQKANLSNAQLFYADLTKADLDSAILDGALLKGAKLNGANLSNASLVGTWLIAQDSGTDPNQYEAAQVADAFLLDAVLDQAQAAGVDFSDSYFVSTMGSSVQASAQGAFMVRAIFTGALVVGVNCRGTQFSGANFNNASLVGSWFPSCELNPTSDEEHSVPTMNAADIRGALFADVAGGVTTNPANMDGLEMDGATWSVTSGVYDPEKYKDYYGKPIQIYVNYGATVLGTTTSSTTCPNGQNGPCTL